jgi:hypothetical protein
VITWGYRLLWVFGPDAVASPGGGSGGGGGGRGRQSSTNHRHAVSTFGSHVVSRDRSWGSLILMLYLAIIGLIVVMLILRYSTKRP